MKRKSPKRYRSKGVNIAISAITIGNKIHLLFWNNISKEYNKSAKYTASVENICQQLQIIINPEKEYNTPPITAV